MEKEIMQLQEELNLSSCKLKLLKVAFDTEIAPYEVPLFRGAVIDKVGRKHDLFHNHLDDEKYAYRYPLIQYKRVGKRPMIVCVGEGIEEIHKFFSQRSWDIELKGKPVEMKIATLDMNEFHLSVSDSFNTYQLRQWIALNQQSYQHYQRLTGLTDKIIFLENKLVGNILSFAKGVGWFIDKQVQVQITELPQIKPISFKGNKLLTFDIDFKTNVFLPKYIGLGAKASIGMGTVFLKK